MWCKDCQKITEKSFFTRYSLAYSKIFKYNLPTIPAIPASTLDINPRVIVETDNVDGASPYIFNLSLRSVYGMNGMHADGSKATGFKSMVVAQFTGIGLQKDDKAFVIYKASSGDYVNSLNAEAAGIDTPLYLLSLIHISEPTRPY